MKLWAGKRSKVEALAEHSGESVTLTPYQWDIVMDMLRLDLKSEDAANRFGDLRDDIATILEALMRQLGRNGIERHTEK
jgi:hypothetical protein